MQYLIDLYNQFLAHFPMWLHPFISIALAVLLVVAVIQTLKRNFIFLIILVVMLPASIPILKSVVDTLINLIKFLLGQG